MRWWESKEGLGWSTTGRPSWDTPAGVVLVPSLNASFRRRTLRKPLGKEGPVNDGVDYSNLQSTMFKEDRSCTSQAFMMRVVELHHFKADTGTKAFFMWKCFNGEAYYSCFFLLSFHPSLPEVAIFHHISKNSELVSMYQNGMNTHCIEA